MNENENMIYEKCLSDRGRLKWSNRFWSPCLFLGKFWVFGYLCKLQISEKCLCVDLGRGICLRKLELGRDGDSGIPYRKPVASVTDWIGRSDQQPMDTQEWSKKGLGLKPISLIFNKLKTNIIKNSHYKIHI